MSCITKDLVLQETETSVSLPSHKQAMQWTAGKKQRSDSRPRTSASDWTAAKAPFSPTSWTKAQSLTSTTLTRHQTTAMSLSGKVRTLGMCLVTVCLKITVKMDLTWLSRQNSPHVFITQLWNTSMRCGGQISGRLPSKQWRKCDVIVLVFPHCCPPLFRLEEMFPCSGWKQVAGQQQVSLCLAVRCLETSLYLHLFCPSTICPINPCHPMMASSSHIQRNHGCFSVYSFIFSLLGMPLYTPSLFLLCPFMLNFDI